MLKAFVSFFNELATEKRNYDQGQTSLIRYISFSFSFIHYLD
jgi:hypothetical protein